MATAPPESHLNLRVGASRVSTRAGSGRALLAGWRPPRGAKGRSQAVCWCCSGPCSSATPPAKPRPLSRCERGHSCMPFQGRPRSPQLRVAPPGPAVAGPAWRRAGRAIRTRIPVVTPHKRRVAFLCHHRADRTPSASQVAPARAHRPGNLHSRRLGSVSADFFF